MGLESIFQYVTQSQFWVEFITTMIKIAIVVGACANVPPLMVWLERRAPAFMQRRKGPNRVGVFGFRLFGLVQPMADAVKLMFKEEVVPNGADKLFFHLAPVFSMFTSLLIVAAIPFGPEIPVFGFNIPLSIVQLDVGFLFIFAFSSIGVYGVALAGWSCNNKYSLMGALRSAAQMISYEIPLGLSLIPIVMIYNSLDLNTIAQGQEYIWQWGVFKAPVSFFLFLVAMFAETNRAPFDLAESEAELVAGFHTEYGSFKFSLFFFGEYVSMFVLACLISVCFFGGWQNGIIAQADLLNLVGSQYIVALIGVSTLLMKAVFFMWLYVWVRWTLPRFRYDQLMALGWKFMMPVGLVNVAVTALVLAWIRF